MKYALLIKQEQDHCTSPSHHHCDGWSQVYSITSSKLCIAGLFLKDEKRIKKSYQTIVTPISIVPQASHIIDGLWFVTTWKLLIFTVVCD